MKDGSIDERLRGKDGVERCVGREEDMETRGRWWEKRHNDSVKKKTRIREGPLTTFLHTSLFLHFPRPSQLLLLPGSHLLLLSSQHPHHPFPPSCPFFTHLSFPFPSPPSLVHFLIRADWTIVPLLPMFGILDWNNRCLPKRWHSLDSLLHYSWAKSDYFCSASARIHHWARHYDSSTFPSFQS